MLHYNLVHFGRAVYAVVNMQVIDAIGQGRYIELFWIMIGFNC